MPEINCVYLVLGKFLHLWRYMNNYTNNEEINLNSIYTLEKDMNQAQIFSFGPYEEQIHAINICKPSNHIFLQSDIKMVLIIAFESNIKLYNLSIDDQAIDLEFLEVTIQVNSDIEMV